MPYCPSCRSEYLEGIKVCPDCKVSLVDELSIAEEEFLEWKTLARVPNELVADMVKGVLDAAELDVIIHSFAIPAFDGIVGSIYEEHWGEVLVLEEDFDEAKKIIEEYIDSLEDDVKLDITLDENENE